MSLRHRLVRPFLNQRPELREKKNEMRYEYMIEREDSIRERLI